MKTLLLAIPTYNEALVIETNLRKAHSLLSDLLKDFGWTLLVADNGSTDETSAIVERLKGELPRLALWHTERKVEAMPCVMCGKSLMPTCMPIWMLTSPLTFQNFLNC